MAAGYVNGYVRVWDYCNNISVAKLHCFFQGAVRGLVFSPNGCLMAVSSDNILLYNTDNWSAPPCVLENYIDGICDLSFSCDGRQLAACAHNKKTVQVWQIHDKSVLAALTVDNPLWCVACCQTDSSLLACGGGDGFLLLAKIVGADIAPQRNLQGHTHHVDDLAFSPRGDMLASASRDDTVCLWSVVSGMCLRKLRKHGKWENAVVVFFPHGKQVAFSDRGIRIWTICKWSDTTHYLFGLEFKAMVFTLMCVRARLENNKNTNNNSLPRLPLEIWFLIFEQLQKAWNIDMCYPTPSFPNTVSCIFS